MWTVNGVDPNTNFGLKVSGLPGWETAPAIEYLSQRIPGRPGNILLRATPNVAPKRLSVSGVIKGSSNSDMLAKFDAMKGLFSKPSLAVVMNNRPTRQLLCRLDGEVAVEAEGAHLAVDALPVSFTLVADDPFWYDIANTNVVAGNAAGGTAAAQGTAPAWPTITITVSIAVANLLVELYNSASVLQQSFQLTLAGNFAIADVAVINMKNKTVTVNGVPRLDLISLGDFFALDVAQHGDYLTAAWPKVRRGSATSYTVSVDYFKAWR